MSMLWTWFWTSKCLWKTHWRKNNKKSWNQQQKCCTDLSMHATSSPTEACMRCTRNTEEQLLEDVRVCFARDNPCFRWDFPISPETTPLMYFVQDATVSSSQKAHAKLTSMAPILVQHFHIYTWWRIQIWYQRNPHKLTFLGCTALKWIVRACFTKTTRKGPRKNQ